MLSILIWEMNRLKVAIILVVGLSILVITRAAKTALVISALCIIHDIYNCWTSDIRQRLLLIIITLLCLSSNLALYAVYSQEPQDVIALIVIAQISDILQYIFGKAFGHHYISRISPNKTLEGYLGGFISLQILGYFFSLDAWKVSNIYILGILGGIIFSAVKRNLNRKDYSNLLGTHGGWLDRTDSLYFPAWYLYFR